MQREKVTIPWTPLCECVCVCLSLNECTWVCRMRHCELHFEWKYLDYIQLSCLCVLCVQFIEKIFSVSLLLLFVVCVSLINSLSAHLMRLIKWLKGWSGIVFGVEPNIAKIIIKEKVPKMSRFQRIKIVKHTWRRCEGRPKSLVCDSVNLLRTKCIYEHFDLTNNPIHLTLLTSSVMSHICFLISNNFWRFVLILIIYFYVRSSLIQ